MESGKSNEDAENPEQPKLGRPRKGILAKTPSERMKEYRLRKKMNKITNQTKIEEENDALKNERERQQIHREKNRETVKQLEAERREPKQNSETVDAEPSTSLNLECSIERIREVITIDDDISTDSLSESDGFEETEITDGNERGQVSANE